MQPGRNIDSGDHIWQRKLQHCEKGYKSSKQENVLIAEIVLTCMMNIWILSKMHLPLYMQKLIACDDTATGHDKLDRSEHGFGYS